MLGFLVTATTAPDPGTIAGDLANSAGGSFLDGVVSVLPKVVPILVGLWALGFVWQKVAPKRKGV